MKKKFVDYYMSMADLTAKLSYAVRLKVGSVIVKDHQVLATGYNGMPAGWENKCETKQHSHYLHTEAYTDPHTYQHISDDTIQSSYPLIDDEGKRYRLKTKDEVLHAESNALMKVAKSTESSDGATLFCTHAPCIDCAKLIYQSGINTVFYREKYRNDAGLVFLKQSGVNVHQYTDSA